MRRGGIPRRQAQPGRFAVVAGGVRSEVVVEDGAYRVLGTRLARIAAGRWFVVSSRPVFRRHGRRLLAGAAGADLDPRPLFVPDGEAAKTWAVLGRLLAELARRGLRRDGGVVALGGGTVGDVAGLAASLALRGVPVVQAPTTLLAAADSALGGKTGVDLPSGKNLAGTFHMPRLVVVDPATLASLPDRAFRSGLAEVLKSALLSPGFFRAMPRLAPRLARRDPRAAAEAIRRSLAVKADVVAEDPFERKGRRHALNLGHTAGHALEASSGYRLTHGEAVAWGLMAALTLSERRAWLAPAVAAAAREWIRTLVAPPLPAPGARRGVRTRLSSDKKADRRGLKAVLLSSPGRVVLARVAPAEICRALESCLPSYNRIED